MLLALGLCLLAHLPGLKVWKTSLPNVFIRRINKVEKVRIVKTLPVFWQLSAGWLWVVSRQRAPALPATFTSDLHVMAPTLMFNHRRAASRTDGASPRATDPEVFVFTHPTNMSVAYAPIFHFFYFLIFWRKRFSLWVKRRCECLSILPDNNISTSLVDFLALRDLKQHFNRTLFFVSAKKENQWQWVVLFSMDKLS